MNSCILPSYIVSFRSPRLRGYKHFLSLRSLGIGDYIVLKDWLVYFFQ